jgi:hypothetical protein
MCAPHSPSRASPNNGKLLKSLGQIFRISRKYANCGSLTSVGYILTALVARKARARDSKMGWKDQSSVGSYRVELGIENELHGPEYEFLRLTRHSSCLLHSPFGNTMA